MQKQPKCLHIPSLYEESQAVLTWQELEGADAYELDCHFDETFADAMEGRSWQDLQGEEMSWSDIQELEGSWQDLHTLPARGRSWRAIQFHDATWADIEASEKDWKTIHELEPVFTVYRGEGNEVPGPEQGFCWSDIHDEAPSWQDLEDAGLTWIEMMKKRSRGLSWQDLHEEELSWSDVHTAEQTWLEFARKPSRGMSWDDINARHFSWQDIQDRETTWMDMRRHTDDKNHRSWEVDIPLYSKKAIFRLRAIAGGERSGYLTTALYDLLPRSLKNYAPPCIHVPQLYEGEAAEISWGDLYGAQAFVLERKLDNAQFQQRYDGPGREKTLACPELDAMKDVDTHLAYTDQIPIGTKKAAWRVKAYNTTDASQYVESAEVQVVPLFYREESTTIAASGTLYVQLITRQVADYRNILLTLEYDSSALRLDNVHAQKEYGIDTSDYDRASRIQVVSNTPGKLTFRCVNTSGQKRTGLNALLRFTGLRSGSTQLKLH